MHNEIVVRRLRDLSLEAADALWALAKGKEPDRDPIAINQDIHNLRSRIDAAFSASSMSEEQVLQALDKVGAIIIGSHVVYASGKHGTAYINKDALYPYTHETSSVCWVIAERFADSRVEVVLAPAVGGVILSQWTAYHLTEITGRNVLGVYADKAQNPGSPLWYICFGLRLLWKRIPQLGYGPTEHFVIRRGYDEFIAGKNVLVVEDVVTTGDSAKKVIEVARAIGGNVIGLGILCNRGEVTPQDVANVPKLTALVNVKLDMWDEATCPLCERNIPINTDVGKGREPLARKRR